MNQRGETQFIFDVIPNTGVYIYQGDDLDLDYLLGVVKEPPSKSWLCKILGEKIILFLEKLYRQINGFGEQVLISIKISEDEFKTLIKKNT